ncbi:lamin tail domain-containing protein 1 [Notechis scutatus]|uniref:Lamin tail domain-containing protein 1 n=1 Tax=Notechis scutatus TaxID=8663 RepID=A0A6J1TYB0_9SAUR|nr:lamin tail domain-containing protein 1 [Notechis scutatus]
MSVQRTGLITKGRNSQAIEKLQTEHTHSQQQIRDLETKLEEIQDHVLSKLKAVEAIQEKNTSLQEEITSLRNTLGYMKGTESGLYQTAAPVHFQHISESETSITTKPSEKVVFSRFTESRSTVTLLRGRTSSRMVRFPISSLVTVDKSLGNTNSSLLQKQYLSCSDTFDKEELGKGQDYMRTLFGDTKKISNELMEKAGRSRIPAEYYSSSSSRYVGNLKITDVHFSGHYVKIINNSSDKEESIGDYTLQQNMNGHPTAIFRFPPNIRMKPNSCVTAVAWYTPINWKRKSSKVMQLDGRLSRKSMQAIRRAKAQSKGDQWEERVFDIWQGMPNKSHLTEPEPDYILREKRMPPIRRPVQNSWCQSPSSPTHPHYTLGRTLPPGSKEIHMLSQTRTQAVKSFLDLGEFKITHRGLDLL